jgi:hypothetical protein
LLTQQAKLASAVQLLGAVGGWKQVKRGQEQLAGQQYMQYSGVGWPAVQEQLAGQQYKQYSGVGWPAVQEQLAGQQYKQYSGVAARGR